MRLAEASDKYGLFKGLTAWFSTSVEPNAKSVWLRSGGVQENRYNWTEATFIFGDSSTEPDVLPIFNSDRYLSRQLTIFKSSWIGDVVNEGDIRSVEVELGNYILPHPSLHKEFARLQQGGAGDVSFPKTTSKFSARKNQAGPSRRSPEHSHRNQSYSDPWEFCDETTSDKVTKKHKPCANESNILLEENDEPESSSARSDRNRNTRVAESENHRARGKQLNLFYSSGVRAHSSQQYDGETSSSSLSEEFGMPLTTVKESSTSRREVRCTTTGKRNQQDTTPSRKRQPELRENNENGYEREGSENTNQQKRGEKSWTEGEERYQQSKQKGSTMKSTTTTPTTSRRRRPNLQDNDDSDDQTMESDIGNQRKTREKRQSSGNEKDQQSKQKGSKMKFTTTAPAPSRRRRPNLQDNDDSDDQTIKSDIGDQRKTREKRQNSGNEEDDHTLKKRGKLTESTTCEPSCSRKRQDKESYDREKLHLNDYRGTIEKSGSDGQRRSVVKEKRLPTQVASVDKGNTSSFTPSFTTSMDSGIIHINDVVVPSLPLFDFVPNKRGCTVTIKAS